MSNTLLRKDDFICLHFAHLKVLSTGIRWKKKDRWRSGGKKEDDDDSLKKKTEMSTFCLKHLHHRETERFDGRYFTYWPWTITDSRGLWVVCRHEPWTGGFLAMTAWNTDRSEADSGILQDSLLAPCFCKALSDLDYKLESFSRNTDWD